MFIKYRNKWLKIFCCCHDDLNLYFHSFEEIECIVRLTDVSSTRLFYDLLWSDQNKNTSEWGENDRGISLFIFSTEIITWFLTRHDLDPICREHIEVYVEWKLFISKIIKKNENSSDNNTCHISIRKNVDNERKFISDSIVQKRFLIYFSNF